MPHIFAPRDAPVSGPAAVRSAPSLRMMDVSARPCRVLAARPSARREEFVTSVYKQNAHQKPNMSALQVLFVAQILLLRPRKFMGARSKINAIAELT